MPRLKTTLSPEQQWLQTVKYFSLVSRTPWDVWSENYNVRQGNANGIYEWNGFINEFVPRVSGEALREKWQLEQARDPLILDAEKALGLIVKPHRFLHVGDVFPITGRDGSMERFVITGVSSKGTRLCYKRFALSYDKPNGHLTLCDLPGDLIGCRWDDPAVARFVETLRVRCRRQVDAGILAPPVA